MYARLEIRPSVRLPRWLFILGAALIVILVGVGLWYRFGPKPIGTTISPPRVLKDFDLRDQDNNLVHLTTYAGKPILMIFGYTNCPDICPLGLVDFKKVKANLGSHGDDIQYMFISVDGDRDTPEVLKRYMSAFDDKFIGLTERPFIISVMGAEYGMRFVRRIESTSQSAYLMGHTTDTYLIDAQGRLTKVYPYAAPTDAIANDVRYMLGLPKDAK